MTPPAQEPAALGDPSREAFPLPGYGPADTERFVAEPGQRPRPPFLRDRARVLHSAGLRRLAAKTQVVHAGWGDFPRTRLTHTLEVAQIGRELGAAVGADADLVETACLAHDIGHPPFGHNGERALDRLAAGIGGFQANAQTLRLVTRLEAKVVTGTDEGGLRSAGLNLTRATLDALTKYPWPAEAGEHGWGVYGEDWEVFAWFREPAPARRRCVEAQIMDAADDIAYSVHDVEDAIHGGFLNPAVLHAAPERAEIARIAHAVYLPDADPAECEAECGLLADDPCWPRRFDASLADLVRLKAMTSAFISEFTGAVEAATRAATPGRLTRYHGEVIVPWPGQRRMAVLKALAYRFVMTRAGAAAALEEQRSLLGALVSYYCDHPEQMAPHHRQRCEGGSGGLLRTAIDEVAELTDTSAWQRAQLVGLA